MPPIQTTPSIHTVPTTVHGRFLLRDAAPGTLRAGLLVGFHGYGQTADTCLADLESIPGAEAWALASIQGLYRFYTKAGEVVAHWMTSQDRELAIADNVDYVRAVLAHIGRTLRPYDDDRDGLPLVYLGFSQGVAMAFRAAAHVDGCAGVIALGGDVPPEIRAAAASLPPVLLGRGAHDAWYTREAFDVDRAWLQEQRIDATVCEFDGGHVWTDVFRHEASRFLARVHAVR